MYHNLIKAGEGDGLNVTGKVFANHMQILKAYGYNAITFEELYAHYMDGASLPPNPVIITFDDGYKSNYTMAYPILKKYGFKACVFVISKAIGNNNYMSAAEIKEVSDSGIIDIQAHSVTHDYYLSKMKKSRLVNELSECKKTLEGITKKPVRIFCYPYGKHSEALVNELFNQGYVISVTTKYGCASKKLNPYLLPRLRVDGRESGSALKSSIEHLTGIHTKYVGLPDSEAASTSAGSDRPPNSSTTPSSIQTK
ncbi:MAG: polysaccharide deacetylase family protein [Clostridia bacterium]|nr:polysaccharide deacetylase family protein [Clostridia bacterium]